jgi:hypothetical protein
MGLTWRDAVSGCLTVIIILAYTAHLFGTPVLLVSSTWAAGATIMVLGMASAIIVTGDLYTRPQPPWGVAVRRITAGIGMAGLALGVTCLLTDSAFALRDLVMLAVALWGIAALWHAVTIGSEQ